VQISAKELRHLASEVDASHHDAMRTFREEAAERHLIAARGRRAFLERSALAAAGGALLTVGGGIARFGPLTGIAAAQEQTDTQLAGYAQSIELAVVATYAAVATRLLPDLRAVIELFSSHHDEHAAALGDAAGDDAEPEPNRALVSLLAPTVEAMVEQDRSEALTDEVLRLGRDLENQAVYTYANALTLLQDTTYAGAAATILPIEAQHATVLAVALDGSLDELFPTGAFEATAVGDGTDPAKGLAPATFA
jgi:hypothetical protein